MILKLHDKYIRAFLSRKMDHIFTVSKTSKEYLSNIYKIDDSKISITYNSVDDIFKKIENLNRNINGCYYSNNYKYIFHLSKYSERKNPDVIIKAFNEINKKNSGIKLILAGSGWSNSQVSRYLFDNKLADKVIFPGFISRENIVELFNISSLFVFPSFYEGFGMPNIESMACGCPVITSNAFAIPEVVGDAAVILKDNTDYMELSKKAIEVIENKKLAERLVIKGLKRSKDFSWITSAETVLRVYDDLINSAENVSKRSKDISR
jgi:glycosyltransferase involved in cell wall biosynthesis